LAVHLGLDEKIGRKEVQKINTYCLPVPGTPFEEVSHILIYKKKCESILLFTFRLQSPQK